MFQFWQLGFLVAASSNARHLKERMEYMNEPYSYSTDNLNGNVKATSAHDKTQTNNNQSDTQIWNEETSWEYLCITVDGRHNSQPNFSHCRDNSQSSCSAGVHKCQFGKREDNSLLGYAF